ncbi:hypothetical protein SVAN01_00888 [Stagonosporopsis vannaccii]|nr:hypothetical protein SVAN01_00888 [Stagonosporopsis vannaccii]
MTPLLGDAAFQCQKENKQPYCWPPNGTRICGGGFEKLLLFWPPSFYEENAYFFVDFGNQTTEGPDNPGEIRADERVAELSGYEKYAEPISNGSGSYEKILRITIREWYPVMDSITSRNHAGPTLTIVPSERTSVFTAAPSSSASPGRDWSDPIPTGKIMGIVFGSVIGAAVLVAVLVWCCRSCCMDGCGAGKRENARVRRQQARRIADEVAAAKPQIDAIKASAARGEVWAGPVRPGGMWVMDLPRRASRPASRASDEIRAVSVVQEQVAEERRIEERRTEERRIEQRRIEERRQEIARMEEVQPPAYDETPAPPKYTP